MGTFNISTFIAIASSYIWLGASPEPQAKQPAAPRLVCVSTSRTSLPDALMLGLATSDPLLDHGLTTLHVSKGTSEEQHLVKGLQASTLKDLSAAESYWVLFSSQGSPISSGVGNPDPGDIASHLTRAMGPSRTLQLREYLRAEPTRWRAREELLQRYCHHIRFKLDRLQRLKPLEPVGAHLDAVVLGPLARELDLMFQGVDWITEFNFALALPSDLPERDSPAMLGVYNRHRATVLHWLEHDPESATLWQALIRINLATGKEDWPRLSSPLPGLRSNQRLYPLAWKGRDILRHAMAMQRPQTAVSILTWIWESHVAPGFRNGWVIEDARQEPYRKAHFPDRDPVQFEKDHVWEHLLAPLLEAMLQAQATSSMQALLASMTGPCEGFITPQRLSSLLKAHHREDLIQPMVALLPSGGMAPAHVFMARNSAGPTFYYDPGQLDRAMLDTWSQAASNLGVFISLYPNPAPPPGIEVPPPDAWTLVSPQGTVLASGRAAPSKEDFLALVQPHTMASITRSIEGFLDQNPMHLMARTLQAELAYRTILAPHAAPGTAKTPREVKESQREAFAVWLKAVKAILQTDLGLHPNTLFPSGLWTPFPAKLEAFNELAKETLGPVLSERLPAALQRRPEEESLWRLWLHLCTPSGRAIRDLLKSLHPLPSPSAPCPSTRLLGLLAEHLAARDQWQDVVDLCKSYPHLLQDPAASQDSRLMPALQRALLALGRGEEADSLPSLQ